MSAQGHTAGWQHENANSYEGVQVPRGATACAGEHPARVTQTAASEWLRWAVAMTARVWSGLLALIEAKREAQRSRHLRLVETVSLGEKRFVAIVAVRGGEFLIGGGASSVSLLARLEDERDLSENCPEASTAALSEPALLSRAARMPACSPWRKR